MKLRFSPRGRMQFLTAVPELPFREVVVPPYRFFYRRVGKNVWVAGEALNLPVRPFTHASAIDCRLATTHLVSVHQQTRRAIVGPNSAYPPVIIDPSNSPGGGGRAPLP